MSGGMLHSDVPWTLTINRHRSYFIVNTKATTLAAHANNRAHFARVSRYDNYNIMPWQFILWWQKLHGPNTHYKLQTYHIHHTLHDTPSTITILTWLTWWQFSHSKFISWPGCVSNHKKFITVCHNCKPTIPFDGMEKLAINYTMFTSFLQIYTTCACIYMYIHSDKKQQVTL